MKVKHVNPGTVTVFTICVKEWKSRRIGEKECVRMVEEEK